MWPWRRRPPAATGAPAPKISWERGPASAGLDVYATELVADGATRVVAGARRPDADLLLTLLRPWACDAFWLLYVLTTSRTEAGPGRYQSERPLDWTELEAWLRRHERFLCGDGRHAVWIASVDEAPRRQLVYEQHDVLYLYGAPYSDQAELEELGFRKGALDLARPHAHHYHPEHDAAERALLGERAWRRFPLLAYDDPGRTDTRGA